MQDIRKPAQKPRTLRSRPEQPELIGQIDMLAIMGFSVHYWNDLVAEMTPEELARIPKPVALRGRPRYRRADVLKWIAGLEVREE